MKSITSFLFVLFTALFAKSQTGTFVALDSKGNLYNVSLSQSGCSYTKLKICNNFTGSTVLSIALDGKILYIVDNLGWLYRQTLNATGNCTRVGRFNSQSTQIYGLTVGPTGMVYAASGNTIETYNPANGQFRTLGNIPSQFQVGGDLLFYQGKLYMAANLNGNKSNNVLVEINLTSPSSSFQYMAFNPNTNVFGFASVTEPCQPNQTYAISSSTNTSDIVAIDMTNKIQSTTSVCTLPFNVYDAASVAETQTAAPPADPAAVSDYNYCQFDNVTSMPISAVGTNVVLHWFTNSSTTSYTLNPNPSFSTNQVTNTTYYVSQYDTSTKCESNRVSFTIHINPNPATPIITPNGNVEICDGKTATLSSSSASSYQWINNGTDMTGETNNTLTVNTSGTYAVRIKNSFGCSATSGNVTTQLIQASLSYSGQPFCAQGTKNVTFTGTSGGKFYASPSGLNIDSLTGMLDLAKSVSNQYQVTYKVGQNGCTFNTLVNIQSPFAVISYSDTLFCKNNNSIQAVIFKAGSVTNGNFSATPAGLQIDQQGNINPSLSSAGKYTVNYSYGTAGVGCGVLNTSTTIIIQDVISKPVVTGSNQVCIGKNYTYNTTEVGGSWSVNPSSLATINSLGVLTPLQSGSINILYTINNLCNQQVGSISVVIDALPNKPTISTNNTLCVGSSSTITSNLPNGAWSVSNPNAVSLQNNSIKALQVESSYIYYTLSNLCGVTKDSVLITVIDTAKITPIIGDTILCKYQTANYTNITTNGIWKSSDNTILDIQSSGLATALNPGKATITYQTSSVCGTKIATIKVNIYDAPIPNQIFGEDSLCVGETVTLNLANSTAGTWQSSVADIATVNKDGDLVGLQQGRTYITYSSNTACGVYIDTFPVFVFDVPTISGLYDKYIIEGKSDLLVPIVNSNFPVTYTWSPKTYLNDSTLDNPTCTPLKNITYQLQVSNSFFSKCAATDKINVLVLPVKQGIPNIFSPNGDGKHDTWDITSLSQYPKVSIKVYTRGGQLIFNSIGYSKPWDGNYNNNPVPIGTYYYIIERGFGLPTISGSVTIIR